MNLSKLYKLQAELDKHIMEKHNIKMSKEELLDNTILALLVEVGELANATRCFKHWSTKGMMDKEVVLDELADVIHFYLSIGNQMELLDKNTMFDIDDFLLQQMQENNIPIGHVFRSLYNNISELGMISNPMPEYYQLAGQDISMLRMLLNFTNEEVEQAYLKKHEENYKRQKEGY